MNGAVADLESWVKAFDFDAMLGVIDARTAAHSGHSGARTFGV